MLTFHFNSDSTLLLEFCYLFLREFSHYGSHTLHQLAELLTHRTEVTLHFLHQHTGTLHETKFLDIHLVHDQVLHCLDMLLLFLIDGRNHNSLQRLTHLDIHLATQGKHHRGNLLSHLHAGLQVLVDLSLISYRELVEMYRIELTAQILVKLVCIERCKRSQ